MQKDENLTVKALLKREAMHALGALALGVVLRFLPAYFTWASLGVLAIKEVWIDPHPGRGYWLKSCLDFAVWTAVILVTVYCFG